MCDLDPELGLTMAGDATFRESVVINETIGPENTHRNYDGVNGFTT